jgi:hypothetical protein
LTTVEIVSVRVPVLSAPTALIVYEYDPVDTDEPIVSTPVEEFIDIPEGTVPDSDQVAGVRIVFEKIE